MYHNETIHRDRSGMSTVVFALRLLCHLRNSTSSVMPSNIK
jgi:hypothetical protein